MKSILKSVLSIIVGLFGYTLTPIGGKRSYVLYDYTISINDRYQITYFEDPNEVRLVTVKECSYFTQGKSKSYMLLNVSTLNSRIKSDYVDMTTDEKVYEMRRVLVDLHNEKKSSKDNTKSNLTTASDSMDEAIKIMAEKMVTDLRNKKDNPTE